MPVTTPVQAPVPATSREWPVYVAAIAVAVAAAGAIVVLHRPVTHDPVREEMRSACQAAVAELLAPAEVIRYPWQSINGTSIRGAVESGLAGLPLQRSFKCSMSQTRGGGWSAAVTFEPR